MKVLPVIHYLNQQQALDNAELAVELGADGVFFIDMSGFKENEVLHLAHMLKEKNIKTKVGINILSNPTPASMVMAHVWGFDMVWTDNQDYFNGEAPKYVQVMKDMMVSYKLDVFTAVAFKYQAKDPKPTESAYAAARDYFIPTTSGAGTGIAADIEKVKAMRESFMYSSWHKNPPIALASGLTPDNIELYKPYITHALVATGINKDFYNLDRELLKTFIERAKS